MPVLGTPHLLRRGEVYYFRRMLPRRLWARFGRRELKFSLKTRDPSQGRLRCRDCSNTFEVLLAEVDRMPSLDKNEIERLVQTAFCKLLVEAEEIVYLFREFDNDKISQEIDGCENQREAIQADIAKGFADRSVTRDAEEIMAASFDSTAAKDLDTRDAICHGLLRARAEQCRIIIAMLKGAYDETAPKDPMFRDMAVNLLPLKHETGPEENRSTLGQIIDKYRVFKASSDWGAKTQHEYGRVLIWFGDHVGPTKRVVDVKLDDVRDFRNTLLKLPKHIGKNSEYSGKSIKDIAASAKKAPKLSHATMKKYHGCVRGFLQWCEDEGYVDVSPAKNIKIGKGANEGEKRKPFSPTQLKELFNSPQYVGHKSPSRRATKGDMVCRDDKFWVPLIGLFTGMRLGEIVQLHVSDVRCENEISYFDINKDEGEDKSLKTKSSQREVPIHPELIQMGFLAYVESAGKTSSKGRIFPSIKAGKNGYYSHNFSKYFGRYLGQTGIKASGIVFHSFRHSFTDALRVGEVEDSIVKALLGHSDQTVTAGYGSTVPLKVLDINVKKVSHDIDLSHLYK